MSETSSTVTPSTLRYIGAVIFGIYALLASKFALELLIMVLAPMLFSDPTERVIANVEATKNIFPLIIGVIIAQRAYRLVIPARKGQHKTLSLSK